MTTIIGQAKADFLEKSRKFSFLAILALCLFGAFWFVPGTGNEFEVFALSPDLVVQGGNPSWIPIVSAYGLAFFLPLIGFFYLRGSIAYDEELGVEQLIASTTAGCAKYLLGKFTSGLLLLCVFGGFVILGSFFMTVWHFPGQFLSLRSFFTPYMFIFPSLSICVALAVLFGSSRLLRGSFGAVIYISYVFTMVVVSSGFGNDESAVLYALDITAMSTLRNIIVNTAFMQTGQLNTVWFLGGYGVVEDFQPTLQVFFNVLSIHNTHYATMLFMIIYSAGFLALSVPLYRLTKAFPKSIKVRGSKRQASVEAVNPQVQTPIYSAAPQSDSIMWTRGIYSEIKLMLNGQHIMWKLIAITGIALSAFLDISVVLMYITPLTMLWLVNVFSQLGCREHKYDMLQIISTIPGGRLRQIVYSWIAGVVIAFIVALPVIVRLGFTGQFVGLLACVAGAVFLPSFAMFLGEYTKTNRFFEVLFIIVTYAIVNGVSVTLYMGHPDSPSLMQGFVYLVLGICFAGFAVVKRGKFA